MSIEKTEYQDLLNELITLIENAKKLVVSQANSALTVLFWHVGKRILNHNLQNKEENTENKLSLQCHENWLRNSERITRKRT